MDCNISRQLAREAGRLLQKQRARGVIDDKTATLLFIVKWCLRHDWALDDKRREWLQGLSLSAYIGPRQAYTLDILRREISARILKRNRKEKEINRQLMRESHAPASRVGA
jgi:hypothetical protein